MKLIVLILLSCFTCDIQSMEVTCTHHPVVRYDCKMENAVHTVENAYFYIYAKFGIFNVEEQVFRLEAINSVLHYVPMSILTILKNLQELVLRGVQLKELRPLINCGNLEFINLNDNELKSIGRVFDACTNLYGVYMDKNQIVSIDSDAFKRLTALEFLFMPYNQIKEIHDEMFVANSNLEYLDLRWSNIKLLPPRIFKSLTSLRVLWLFNNPFNSPHDISNHFEGLSSLEHLDLQNCSISDIREGTFKDLVSLKFLELSRNNISSLRAKIFDPLVNLETLLIYSNQIVTIDAGVFKKLESVKNLQLQGNIIEFFADDVFENLNSLENLAFDFNPFSTLKLATFGDLPNLLQLYIGDSNLNSLSRELFKKFPKLNYLKALNTPCVNKEFKDFDPSMLPEELQSCFEKVLNCISHNEDSCAITGAEMVSEEKFVTIDGTGNFGSIRIVHASNSIFEFIPQIIFNEFNQLSRLELKSVRMKELRPLKNCSSLTHLNLDDNNLIELPEKVFDECQSLTEISLKDNAILLIHQNSFEGLKLLESLYISNAAYKMTPSEGDEVRIHRNTFDQQTMLTNLHLSFKRSLEIGTFIEKLSLRTLRLNNNEIKELSDELLKPFVNLQFLDLNSNIISEIHENAFKSLISLRSLDLSNNHLAQLHQNIFLNTFNLDVTITLDGNQFEILPDIFKETQHLAELSMNNNKLKSLASPGKLHQIKKLSFRDNKIVSIAKIFFNSTANLNELNLDGNGCINQDFKDFSVTDPDFIMDLKTCVENFVMETFCVFSHSKFGYSCSMKMDQDTNENILESGRNHLENRTDDDVQYLHLDTPLISIDLPKIFEKFQRLERVKMKNPSIESIAIIEHCQALRSFDIRLNALSQLSGGVFSNCKRIESLILTQNHLSAVTKIEATTLTQLNLSFNELSSFPEGFFNSSSELKSLILSHNKLSVFNWVTQLKSLTVLDLSHNKMTSVNFDVFLFQDDLIELHLNDNDISTIYGTDQIILQRLQYLNLANNALLEFELATVIPKSLQYLDISNNKIASINFIQEAENHLTDFHATGNVCINRSFENIEDFDEVLPKGHDCFTSLR